MERTINGFLFKGKSDSISVYKDGNLLTSKIIDGILFEEDFNKITKRLAEELLANEVEEEVEEEM
ncbi:hypothetical protein BJV85_002971 [Clostridium acetobutylicum]|uniref:Uncharacterized protein n=1 Tax=Clostridium acetobutylicum (strain ATCC 824 / DSM 792 / JCM 1419 / IAM 19013 / LMG 5710 / NBRC 13948 / NRRL B-527 / VKM B-1787 / 2291 / W) TaxID=272562 RepID=Q97K85_CLOAB|nr:MULTISPECIES: hypothetical protein [Clostridium]AAK79010.1 Hypothetical protein CA_C1034 [Clostridium acetobutylicum ATCC 824]ADZ20085.1 Conserved hypothetical protein [Clostridium acetobutylicum EA 2018]AEI31568.1 hypothetical protein SMB_G1052 [Clostridium acetobutylicum DSM 1731]AWV81734.1 hypothetical protein DK921_16890 [Clostridium acetobutylicum]MBC2395276.1 hypothetical protein [Clostridium acetobutylicum]